MKDINDLFGSGNVDEDRITNLVLEMNELDLDFDIRFIDDMEIGIILDRIFKIAKELNLENAIKEIEEIEMQTKLLTFAKKRKELFNSQESELTILSTGKGQVVSFEDAFKKAMGWDNIDTIKRYDKSK